MISSAQRIEHAMKGLCLRRFVGRMILLSDENDITMNNPENNLYVSGSKSRDSPSSADTTINDPECLEKGFGDESFVLSSIRRTDGSTAGMKMTQQCHTMQKE
ncbi:hypothetical protein CDAR_77761 [Caerostris darwini]|uniref:Uncharacterized protein n=1 Tax=Caerostris darwini TaxID=1538125 RepID=A0AAV4VT70_9ARAC|nr:hypothetical protein CDAR_77761 [Caerostris darwini]